MLEVEMKFLVADLDALRLAVLELGAHEDRALEEADHYFNAPDRDFAKTDEALRIRCIGSANYVTYKGPKRDAHTKTRTEIETPLGEGDEVAFKFCRLLKELKYRPVATVCKRRTIYHLRRADFLVDICLDEVEGVGTFAELEIQAEEDGLDQARSTVMELAMDLGLTQSERRSYLELLLEKTGRK